MNNMFCRLALWKIEIANKIGTFLPQLVIRLLLAWEFGTTGWEKFNGSNGFTEIQDKLLYPFNVIDPNISWMLVTYSELIGAILLIFGLATRSVSIILMFVVFIAMSMHIPTSWDSCVALSQYACQMCNGECGNFKLLLIYMVLFLPLVFNGAGKLS
jgi:putative oxidoreductase